MLNALIPKFRIDQALQTGNIKVLREISAEQKCAYQSSNEGDISSVDENSVLNTYMKAYVPIKSAAQNLLNFHACLATNYALNENAFFYNVT